MTPNKELEPKRGGRASAWSGGAGSGGWHVEPRQDKESIHEGTLLQQGMLETEGGEEEAPPGAGVIRRD